MIATMSSDVATGRRMKIRDGLMVSARRPNSAGPRPPWPHAGQRPAVQTWSLAAPALTHPARLVDSRLRLCFARSALLRRGALRPACTIRGLHGGCAAARAALGKADLG